MKLRFLGLLTALGLGSAAVLIYASHSSSSSAALEGGMDCSACPLSAKPATASVSVENADDCCAAEAAAPVAATVEKTD